ncbi:hypothetical protein [Streptomyces sp. NPDC021562]|uniref:hypothetical protein n=1 Tax=Streptomyces sp. NPDC021562 TaxID=3155121 RepID=UPI0034010F90
MPWTSATAITGTDVSTSAVAIWNQFAQAGAVERKLYAAVRPAGSDTWGAPALIATTPDETSPRSGPFDIRVVSSVLVADHSTWSAPVGMAGRDTFWGDGGIDLADAPDGTLTALWGARSPDRRSPSRPPTSPRTRPSPPPVAATARGRRPTR